MTDETSLKKMLCCFSPAINIKKFYMLNCFSFSGPNRILSLITFRTNIGPYDIKYGYICYFDKFDRNGMYSANNKELPISLFMRFRIFNFRQIKMIFRGDENLKKDLYCKCKCL